MTALTTDRFTLRKPQASDVPAWTAFYLSKRGTWNGGGPGLDEGRAWRSLAAITGHWTLHGCGPFVIEDRKTGAPLGMTGPWFPVPWPEREILWGAWRVDVEGTGAIAEAAREVLRHVFHDLGWTTAVSYIDPANARSRALAERLGATEDPAAVRMHPEDLVFRHQGPEEGA